MALLAVWSLQPNIPPAEIKCRISISDEAECGLCRSRSSGVIPFASLVNSSKSWGLKTRHREMEKCFPAIVSYGDQRGRHTNQSLNNGCLAPVSSDMQRVAMKKLH
ncbi:histone-lysine N-methyltransferase setd3-like isoform X1 [Gossypium australe]|uniref:Histone-lysine N-methyltransferase setd3-like isoform X1 n=1 Tax=Gossypium australe TaxID=47621 RepID=A0A5B6W2Q1_9ROSI|nr:histone-lysine N-methyltransferase setd3-like isoform X1 [Gossypium australe]